MKIKTIKLTMTLFMILIGSALSAMQGPPVPVHAAAPGVAPNAVPAAVPAETAQEVEERIKEQFFTAVVHNQLDEARRLIAQHNWLLTAEIHGRTALNGVMMQCFRRIDSRYSQAERDMYFNFFEHFVQSGHGDVFEGHLQQEVPYHVQSVTCGHLRPIPLLRIIQRHRPLLVTIPIPAQDPAIVDGPVETVDEQGRVFLDGVYQRTLRETGDRIIEVNGQRRRYINGVLQPNPPAQAARDGNTGQGQPPVDQQGAQLRQIDQRRQMWRRLIAVGITAALFGSIWLWWSVSSDKKNKKNKTA